MTNEEKICPFMFSPARTDVVYIGDGQYRFDEIPEKSHPCEGERCMAWGCVEKFVAKDIKHEVYEHKVMGCRLIP